MRTLTTMTIAILLAACGGGEGDEFPPDTGGGDGGGGDPVVDTTAPTVISMLPENGSAGVREEAVVVIEFSEAMDQLSVQNSLNTNDLGAVAYDWSNDSKTLTVTPSELLRYAEGIDPDALDAIQYVATLGIGGTDEAGNALAQGSQTIFTTLREISVTVEDINELTAAVNPGEVVGTPNNDVYIGDDGQGALAKASRAVVTMDLSSLPDDSVEISAATFHAFQSATFGQVYVELGALLMDHATFDVTGGDFDTATDLDCNFAFNLEELAPVGVLMDSEEDVNVELDVTEFVQDDLENRVDRNDRSQFRFRLVSDQNLDGGKDGVSLHRDFFELDVVYLVP